MREYAPPERCVPSEIANPPGRYILRATMDAERDTELSKMVAVGDIRRKNPRNMHGSKEDSTSELLELKFSNCETLFL